MNTLRNYFIGAIMKNTDDVFEHAKAVLVLRLGIMFFLISLLPLINDLVFEYYKAMVFDLFSSVLLLFLPIIIKKQRNIQKSINLFLTICFFNAFIAHMILNPMVIEPIGISWEICFLTLSALLQNGKTRVLFCCLLNWLPLLYVLINIQLNGALTWSLIVQEGIEYTPIVLVFIPISLSIYAVWTHTLTIEQARLRITEQKKLIIEKNKSITDSINYAKKIQQATLPRIEDIILGLPNLFVLFKPKDIVSGDFYFYKKTEKHIFIAAADCTGHGVPGALMSMLGSEKLEEAVAQSTIPSQILQNLNH